MVQDMIGFRHERYEEQISNHQHVIGIYKNERNIFLSLLDKSKI